MSRSHRKAPSRIESTTAPVHAVAASADVFIEAAAIIRAVLADIVPRFHATEDRLPPLLLQRRGQGPRAASVEAIVHAESELEGLARALESQAHELYGRSVDVACRLEDHTGARPLVDEVVDGSSAESARRKPSSASSAPPSSPTDCPRS